MRGRNATNKLRFRKEDVYKLLLRLGGEARWRDLESHLPDLQMGPTMLKNTLDSLIEEGAVRKEARATKKGPEVWYIAKVQGITVLLKSIIALADIQPKQLEEWRSAALQSKLKDKITEKMSLADWLQALKEAEMDYYILLWRACWIIHNLVCKLGFPELGNTPGYLGFTELNDLKMIPTKMLSKNIIKGAPSLKMPLTTVFTGSSEEFNEWRSSQAPES
jgi:predicted transcriptional regulator